MYNNHFSLAKIFIQSQIDDFKLWSKNHCVVSSYPLAYIFIIRSIYHEQRSLVGYSPQGCKESDTTEWLHFLSSAFSKPSLNIWKFTVHVLLKLSLKNFEHSFASKWDECNCAVAWAFFGIAFLWDWNENWPFPVLRGYQILGGIKSLYYVL